MTRPIAITLAFAAVTELCAAALFVTGAILALAMATAWPWYAGLCVALTVGVRAARMIIAALIIMLLWAVFATAAAVTLGVEAWAANERAAAAEGALLRAQHP